MKIQSVIPGSIAEEAGIEPGDVLVSVNGKKVRDIFDYRFFISEEDLLVEVQKPDGDILEVDIEKDEYEDLGIEFETSLMDEPKSCTNKCIFCFIDQLPKGMRETLYFKDDDSRLSFLMGNYVTLTNMKDEDMDRIIEYHMSPINISVHTTNPDLRIAMLRNRFAGNVMERIRKLTESGITVNCQIVLCRDINDGAELDRTIKDLASLYPGVNSISVVPVGLTRYRDGLYRLKPFDRESSRQVISQVGTWQKRLLKEKGSRVVYIADEFYIMAGLAMPGYDEYEDFPQIENGVGLIAKFRYEFLERLDELDAPGNKKNIIKGPKHRRKISIATGVSAYGHITELVGMLADRFEKADIHVYDIKNDFFGENVTVTGLLTGRDLVSQLSGKDLGDELLICRCMLKAGEDVFLDDYTVDMVQNELAVKVTVVDNNGSELVDRIIGTFDNAWQGTVDSL